MQLSLNHTTEATSLKQQDRILGFRSTLGKWNGGIICNPTMCLGSGSQLSGYIFHHKMDRVLLRAEMLRPPF
jgi:hypothetical protein